MREIEAAWQADELGPVEVVFLRPMPRMEAVVVLDNLALGPAIGGVRLTPTVTAAEVARLARAMTIKNAAAGLPHGGGKAGIMLAPSLAQAPREREMRAFARAIEHLTGYIPGPDMGTDESCMAVVHDEIGRAVGLPAVLGGIPLDELGATGYGLACCASALAEAKVLELEGARVVVQGFGAVGMHAALELRRRGAVVVAVSDSRGAVRRDDGLDVAELAAFKRARGLVAEFPGGDAAARDEIVTLPCEVLVPAAQPDVLTGDNAGRVRAEVILQGANIPATAEAEEIFHRLGILSVPDVIANAGGVICAAVEYAGGGRERAFAAIEEKIGANTAELADRIARTGDLPRRAATEMALSRIRAAQAYRRRF
ncbi:Glu/Leu/Phe/Val dehydrogenase [Planobispora siamensis]|uniref:Glutamate dehydrogenase n=1 Tax=Planobispora siamensis TaxID=936338 RepID=A0A8J3SN91_9ACTN|nr:Glu/Leu/Phe/Val dehydrogenase [Planobispora siamensis]GIH96329.1 glutamate dehydrogenase [Planobispora siamensis]